MGAETAWGDQRVCDAGGRQVSSTNRSDARNKHVADYYRTPVEAIDTFIKHFIAEEPNAFTGLVLDPCAGGVVGKETMSYPEALSKIGVSTITMDIRHDSPAQAKGDFLQTKPKVQFDCCITNPPFNIAQDIINKALDITKTNGWVIMLLRLNYFGSQKRKKFFESFRPEYAFIHSERMSFTGGPTDSIEYMHCCWRVGSNPNFTKTKVI